MYLSCGYKTAPPRTIVYVPGASTLIGRITLNAAPPHRARSACPMPMRGGVYLGGKKTGERKKGIAR